MIEAEATAHPAGAAASLIASPAGNLLTQPNSGQKQNTSLYNHTFYSNSTELAELSDYLLESWGITPSTSTSSNEV